MRNLDKELKEKKTPVQIPLHLPIEKEEDIIEEETTVETIKSITIDI